MHRENDKAELLKKCNDLNSCFLNRIIWASKVKNVDVRLMSAVPTESLQFSQNDMSVEEVNAEVKL